MGWLFVNLVVPATLPLAILLCLKLVDMPEPYAARGKLLRAVPDGQLGAGTAVTTLVSGVFYALVHYGLPRTAV